MKALKLLVVLSLILPAHAFGQKGGSSSSPNSQVRTPTGPSGGGGGSASFRPSPVRTNPSGVSNPSQSLTNPLNPLSPFGLLSPISPLSPLNPINQMNLSDDNGVELFSKVLKLENDAGTIRAFQCLVHRDEFKNPEPMEQNCVLIGKVSAAQVQAFESRKQMCWEFSSEDALVFGLLGVFGGVVGAVGGLVILEMMSSISLGRYLAGGVVVGTVLAALAFKLFHGAFGDTCEKAVALLAQRLYEELEGKVSPGYARLVKVDDSIWTILDAVISGSQATPN